METLAEIPFSLDAVTLMKQAQRRARIGRCRGVAGLDGPRSQGLALSQKTLTLMTQRPSPKPALTKKGSSVTMVLLKKRTFVDRRAKDGDPTVSARVVGVGRVAFPRLARPMPAPAGHPAGGRPFRPGSADGRQLAARPASPTSSRHTIISSPAWDAIPDGLPGALLCLVFSRPHRAAGGVRSRRHPDQAVRPAGGRRRHS